MIRKDTSLRFHKTMHNFQTMPYKSKVYANRLFNYLEACTSQVRSRILKTRAAAKKHWKSRLIDQRFRAFFGAQESIVYIWDLINIDALLTNDGDVSVDVFFGIFEREELFQRQMRAAAGGKENTGHRYARPGVNLQRFKRI